MGAILDGLGRAVTIDDGGGVLGDHDLTAVTQIFHLGVRQLHVQLAGNDGAAGEHSDILKHFLPAVAEAGGLHADHVEAALQTVQQQRCQSVALHVLGDDHQLAAGLDDGLQNGQDLLDGGNLLIGNQDVGVVQDGLHLVGVGDHVGGDIAPVELHTLDHVQTGLGGLALLDGDDAFLAHLLHGLGDQLADGLVAGGHGADTGNGIRVGHGNGIGLDGLNGSGNGLVDALAHDHGVGAGGQVLQALPGDGLCQQGGGGGAVTGHIIGLGGDLPDELCAHVLEGVLQLHFLGNGHAVVGDEGRAVLLAQNHVAALGSQGNLNGIGQLVNAGLQLLAGFFAVNNHLGHDIFSSLVSDDSQNVVLLDKLVIFLIDGHVGAGELADNNLLTGLDGHGDVLGAGADGNDLVDHGLFLVGGSQNNAGDGGLGRLVGFQQNVICHGLEFHFEFLHTYKHLDDGYRANPARLYLRGLALIRSEC